MLPLPFPNNLPQQMTSFIGRRREMAKVKRLLSATRLLTLTGAGGCGKTRLALQVATRQIKGKEYPGGVWLVDLAALTVSSSVPQAVAAALGVREQSGQSLLDTLIEHLCSLQPLRVLLILDNCEHLIPACQSLTSKLLDACPNLRVLVTSRQSLGAEGEIAWRVPSLTLPDNPKQQLSVKDLMQYEAIRLFNERATYKWPGFALTIENAQLVAKLCYQLDGIPLAIELAAARVNVLSVDEIVERLDDRFRLFTSGSLSILPRHQTLQATIEWSYDLLSESEKSLFRNLGVFAGGFTLAALKAVREQKIEEYETISLLAQLVDKSLVTKEERSSKSRYRLLETVRQYAWEKLRLSGELAVLRNRHLRWCMELAEDAEPELKGAQREQWIEQLTLEQDNFRAALAWVKESKQGGSSADGEMGLRLAGALWYFWYIHGPFSEGREHLLSMLSLDEERGNYPAKRVAGATSAASRAKALLGAGTLDWMEGKYDRAAALIKESVELYRGLGDKYGLAFSLNNLGLVVKDQQDFKAARLIYEESLALRRELKDTWGIAQCLGNLGIIEHEEGDYEATRSLFEESLALYREAGDKQWVAAQVGNLGFISLEQGDLQSALVRFRESLAVRWHLRDKPGVADCLEGLAELAAAESKFERAVRIWSSAAALRKAISAALNPSDRAVVESAVAAARSQLGEDTFAEIWREGQALSLEEVIAYASEEVNEPPKSIVKRVDEVTLPHLTKREAQVLRLITQGLSDVQIANRLSVSPNTVHSHLHHIFTKLNITTRSEATRFAAEHGLL